MPRKTRSRRADVLTAIIRDFFRLYSVNFIGMRKIVYICLAMALLTSCRSAKDVVISGRLIGINARTVYLENMSLGGQNLLDSVELAQDGSYRFLLHSVPQTPSMFNIIYNNERVPLLVSAGEKVEVNSLGSVAANYTVSGSEESELLRVFNQNYITNVVELNTLMAEYAKAEGDDKGDLARAYNQKYRDLKRQQITFIVENKDRIAAVYALYQRLPGEQFLANADSDIIYFRTVADALTQSHPESPYLITLRNDVARMEARASLMQSIEERSYPELVAPDMYGNDVKLSSLEGDVILVDFWSAELGNSNAMNADLKVLYSKYHEAGFSVYQVSVDLIKSVWITAVQEQHLPWISVCDFKGERSPMLGVYNVQHIPSNYLIDKKGMIVGKDLYGTALENKLKELMAK